MRRPLLVLAVALTLAGCGSAAAPSTPDGQDDAVERAIRPALERCHAHGGDVARCVRAVRKRAGLPGD